MDPLQCNLAAMFLHRNPGHFLSGSAAKIAADGFFGVLTLLRLYTRPKGRNIKMFFFVYSSTPIEAAWKDEASGLLLPFSDANRGA